MTNCVLCSNEVKVWSEATDVEYASTELVYFYFQCLACEILFLENPPVNFLNKIYPPDYYSFKSTERNLIYRIKSSIERRIVASQTEHFKTSENLEILDLGGGSGYFADICLDLFPNATVSVVDFEITNPTESKSLIGVKKFVRCDLNVDFPIGKFDLIIAWNILEHVVNPTDFLLSCYQNLSEEGVLILQTPNFDTLSAKVFRKFYWGGLHSPRHFVLFNDSSLLTAVKEIGFKNTKIKFVQGAHFWAVSICNYYKLNAEQNGKPLYKFRSYKFLLTFFAFLDGFLSLISKTGQMQLYAKKDQLSSNW